jgi:hypothetical protein
MVMKRADSRPPANLDEKNSACGETGSPKTGSPKTKQSDSKQDLARQQRLGAALRENLQRRKAQHRARREGPGEEKPET